MGRILDAAGSIILLSTATSILAPRYSPGFLYTLLLLFTSTFLISFYNVVLYPRFFSPLRNVPQPDGGHWLFGQIKTIMREPAGMPQCDWVDNVPNDGVIRYSNWFVERILVASPKALSEVLVTKSYDFIKPPQVRHTLIRILGEGILVAEGDEHRRQRKLLMPAFAFRHVKDLYPTFWQKSRQLSDKLAVLSRSTEPQTKTEKDITTTHAPGAVEVYEEAAKATLDIIGVSGMGHDFNSLENPNNKLSLAYQSVFKHENGGGRGLLRIISMLIGPGILQRLPLKANHDIAHAMGEVKQVCRELIENKRRALREKTAPGADIISVAVESGGFTDEELVNQMMTFLLAGHETTSTALTWAIYLLCKRPDVQTKLREEIRANIPSDPSQFNSSHIDNCQYLHAVCSETLRLWGPVAMTLRVAANDTSIGTQFVPKGSFVILAPWAISRSVKYWGSDAREFRPERWLDANGKANKHGSAESNYSFMTFLHGPRSCIGQKFAEAEFACLLAMWVGRFQTEFETGSPHADVENQIPEIRGGVTSRPKKGVWVKLTEIEGW